MICYKDQSFCSSDCVNKLCHRHLSEEVKESANKANMLIALIDFMPYCENYIIPTKENENE